VLDLYRGKVTTLHNLYTDASTFFAGATYPTRGMRQVLYDVFGRLAGNNTLPATHRLETGFGGGKTPTLIACTHLAHLGPSLQALARSALDTGEFPISAQLSGRRGVTVVGVAGERLPVVQSRRDVLAPYPLWAEIARQVGGDELLAEVGPEALSPAAPGEDYFTRVLGGRKVLIMLDELAQYATRLHAVQPSGGAQLAAFLLPQQEAGLGRDLPGHPRRAARAGPDCPQPVAESPGGRAHDPRHFTPVRAL
jgi:predicted AAA+ superfamily ATPase